MNWNIVPELADLRTDLPYFAQRLTALAARLGLDLTAHHIDHIALRCRHDATAERWFDGWLRCGCLFKHSEFNGRPIALFNVPLPVCVGPLSIECIELPWPGQRVYPHEGWEHIEIVLPGPPETLTRRALALLSDSALAASDISLKHSAPASAGDALPNPTLVVTDGAVTIKFHPHSLRAVIASEANY